MEVWGGLNFMARSYYDFYFMVVWQGKKEHFFVF